MCPKYKPEDFAVGAADFNRLLESSVNNTECRRKHTTSAEQRFYLNTDDAPSMPPGEPSLNYLYLKEIFDATSTLKALRNPTKLEKTLKSKAQTCTLAATRLFAELKKVIKFKFGRTTGILVPTVLEDPKDASKNITENVSPFASMMPTKEQKAKAEFEMNLRASLSGESYATVKNKIKTAEGNKQDMTDSDTHTDETMVLKYLNELLFLNFDVTCQFIDDPKNPYVSCIYTLTGASVDYSSIKSLLETLASKTTKGLQALGVIGLDKPMSSKTLMRIMVAHYEDDNILNLADFRAAIFKIMPMVSSMEILVSSNGNSNTFTNIASKLFSSFSSGAYETIAEETGAPSTLENFGAKQRFQPLMLDLIQTRDEKVLLTQSVRDPTYLKSAMTEIKYQLGEAYNVLPNKTKETMDVILETAFNEIQHAARKVGNTSHGLFDDLDECGHLFGRVPKTFLQGTDKVLGTGLEKIDYALDNYFNYIVFIPVFFLLFWWKSKTGFNAAAETKGFLDVGSTLINHPYYKNELTPSLQTNENRVTREIDTQGANPPSANPRLTIEDAPRQQNRVELANHIPMTRQEIISQLERQSPSWFLDSQHKDVDRTIKLTLRPAIVDGPKPRAAEIMSGKSIFKNTVYKLEEVNGGAKTRKHKKRIGAASKHHKKRRRGTKKPSKKRRATRRKRR
jgi:hypothetical protein